MQPASIKVRIWLSFPQLVAFKMTQHASLCTSLSTPRALSPLPPPPPVSHLCFPLACSLTRSLTFPKILMQPASIKVRIWLSFPQLVAFKMTQHASLCTSLSTPRALSPLPPPPPPPTSPSAKSTNGAIHPESRTACICEWVPADMFDSVQHASF